MDESDRRRVTFPPVLRPGVLVLRGGGRLSAPLARCLSDSSDRQLSSYSKVLWCLVQCGRGI